MVPHTFTLGESLSCLYNSCGFSSPHIARQHLRQFYFNRDRRHPQSFTQRPKEKEKGVATSLSASSLLATAPRVPPAWSLGSCLVPARVVSPLVRTGWRKMAGAPSHERGLGTAPTRRSTSTLARKRLHRTHAQN